MPSNTAGGWPYPLPTEPVKDGANAIKNLADQAQLRTGPQCMFGVYAVATFDSNGLWVYNWSSWGVTWTTMPGVSIMPGSYSTGGYDSGLHVNIYQSQNTLTKLALCAQRIKDGAGYSGAMDLYIVAVGNGRR